MAPKAALLAEVEKLQGQVSKVALEGLLPPGCPPGRVPNPSCWIPVSLLSWSWFMYQQNNRAWPAIGDEWEKAMGTEKFEQLEEAYELMVFRSMGFWT